MGRAGSGGLASLPIFKCLDNAGRILPNQVMCGQLDYEIILLHLWVESTCVISYELFKIIDQDMAMNAKG